MTKTCRSRRPGAAAAAAAAVIACLALSSCGLYTHTGEVRPLRAEADASDVRSAHAAVRAPEPADLVVTGRGFTQLRGTYASEPAVTWAVVVANTGEETASFSKVRVTFQDRGGRVVETREDVLATVYPGDTVALGEVLPGVQRVTKMHVEVLPGRSERVAGRPAVFEVTDVETRKVMLGPLKTTATVTSEFSEGLWHLRPVAVYRDKQGAVIGGAEGRLRFVPERGTTSVNVADADVRDLPGLTGTDVYVSLSTSSFAP